MAKKVRRVRRLSATQTYEPTAEAAMTPAIQQSASSSRQVDFREEYRYILSDLQRIGILAAIMLSGLVILSFLIK